MKPDRSRANKSGQIHLLTTTRILHEGDDEVGIKEPVDHVFGGLPCAPHLWVHSLPDANRSFA